MNIQTSSENACASSGPEILARLGAHYRALEAAAVMVRFTRSDAPGAQAVYDFAAVRPRCFALELRTLTTPVPESWSEACSSYGDAERLIVVHRPPGAPEQYARYSNLPATIAAVLMATPDTMLTPSAGREAMLLAALLSDDPADLISGLATPAYAGQTMLGSVRAHRVTLVDADEPPDRYHQELVIDAGERPWLLGFVTRWSAEFVREQSAELGIDSVSGAIEERLEFSDWSSRGVRCPEPHIAPDAQRVASLSLLFTPPGDVPPSCAL